MKIKIFRNEETIFVDIILGKPYLDNGFWWCSCQIIPNCAKVVKGPDSYRALQFAFFEIIKDLKDNFDSSSSVEFRFNNTVHKQKFGVFLNDIFGAEFVGTQEIL